MKRFFMFIAAISMFASSVCAFAQNDRFSIVTGHPDFKIKVQRCEASGSTCVIDMLLMNMGNKDVQIDFYGGESGDTSKAYDDEGNMYTDRNFRIGCGSKEMSVYWQKDVLLPAGVPVRARIEIEGIVPYATKFMRIDLGCRCEAWGLTTLIGYEKYIKMYNVPISREGD